MARRFPCGPACRQHVARRAARRQERLAAGRTPRRMSERSLAAAAAAKRDPFASEQCEGLNSPFPSSSFQVLTDKSRGSVFVKLQFLLLATSTSSFSS